MNTNDLPPAARLAALIEAGRAANPDLAHGRGTLLTEKSACALGFAGLGAGVSRETLRDPNGNYVALAKALGTKYAALSVCAKTVYGETMRRNDRGATLADICRELREGELARVECPVTGNSEAKP